MKTNIIISTFIIGLIAFGSYVIYDCPDVTNKPFQNRLTDTRSDNAVIVISEMEAIPDIVTIKKGAKVTWINNDSVGHIIAANPHPDHSELPELVSYVIEPHGVYTFVFNEIGEYGYHSHLHPTLLGKVIVVE